MAPDVWNMSNQRVKRSTVTFQANLRIQLSKIMHRVRAHSIDHAVITFYKSILLAMQF